MGSRQKESRTHEVGRGRNTGAPTPEDRGLVPRYPAQYHFAPEEAGSTAPPAVERLPQYLQDMLASIERLGSGSARFTTNEDRGLAPPPPTVYRYTPEEAGPASRVPLSRGQRPTPGQPEAVIAWSSPQRMAHESASPFATIVPPFTINLDAIGSSDPHGRRLRYRWVMEGLPPGSRASIANPGNAQTHFRVDQYGQYRVRLIVSTSDGSHDYDTAIIHVEAPASPLPPATRRPNVQGRTRTILSEEATEAMLQENIAKYRPTIPYRVDIGGMITFDSDFRHNPGLYNFRGVVMSHREINYYFIAMAMAYQGYYWDEAQSMITTWNRLKFQELTDELWFAARQGFDDELRRRRPPRFPRTPHIDLRQLLDL